MSEQKKAIVSSKEESEMLKVKNDILGKFEIQDIQETSIRLGEGAYAYVIQMDYHGLKCAGKKLHQFETSNKHKMLERFNKECEILASLKHPNIVQFLGVHFPENSTLPTLVMEYMYDTLSKMLQRLEDDNHRRLPEEVSYSVLNDVATALCYLHGNSPPIIHRDLTANNVLLSTSMQAKIGDLGLARILDLSVEDKKRKLSAKLSLGCPPYMPPEAQRDNPQYSTEVDCFSYGVLILHTFCGEWPLPELSVAKQNLQYPKALDELSEADRRQKYLSKLGHKHPLKHLILECLSNEPSQRPNADSIQKRVHTVAIRFPPLFENSLQILTENEKLMKQIVELNQQFREQEEKTKNHDNLNAEIKRLQSLLDEGDTKSSYELSQLRGDIKAMSTKLVELASELNSSEKQRSLQESTLTKVEEAFVIKTKQALTASGELKVKHNQLETKEKQIKIMLESHEAQQKELVAKNREQEHKIQELEAIKREIGVLCAQFKAKETQLDAKQERLVALSRQLEASKEQIKLKQEEIGLTREELKHAKTKEDELLQELACKEELIKTSKTNLDHLKVEKLPMLESQMQMKENSIKTLSDQLEEAQKYIYNNKKTQQKCPLQFQFQKCADLPIAMSDPQCAVVDGVVYAGGGLTDEKNGVRGQGQVFQYDHTHDIWSTLPDCPTRLFGLVQFCGNLLLLGGVTEAALLSGTVYKYNKDTRLWESDILPPMTTKRFQMTVFSHEAMLAVCGGITQGRNPTSDVEVFVNGKWHRGHNLPHRCFLSKAVTIGDQCYLMGGLVGITPAEVPTKVVLKAKLSDLFALEGEDQQKTNNVWEMHSTEICQITQYKSTPCNFGGTLLALGGWDCAQLTPSTDFIVYSSKKGFWEKTTDLPTSRSSSTATTQLDSGHVMIIGGIEKDSTATSKRSASVLSMSLYF